MSIFEKREQSEEQEFSTQITPNEVTNIPINHENQKLKPKSSKRYDLHKIRIMLRKILRFRKSNNTEYVFGPKSDSLLEQYVGSDWKEKLAKQHFSDLRRSSLT